MNDLSPPDASAAPTPTVSPPPAEPSATAETPAEPSAEAGAPSEPSLTSEAGPQPELPPESAAPPVAPPPLESSRRWSLRAGLPLRRPSLRPPSPPSPDAFALPLVSEDDPCGPDLDLEGDTEFMNFIAATEGLLPASYYAFNRASIDFPAASQTAEKLLKRTLDMRLLALMAKLSILNRDVAGFAQRLGNIAWLVNEHWEAANPRAEGDDYSGRIAQLATLEDNAVVLLPLQYAPLIETNREGALSYRDQLLATGAAQPRSVTLYDLRGQKQTTEPEKFMPAKSIERVLSDVEIGKLAGAVETLTSLGASIQSIKAATTEHVGFENAVELPKLAKLVGEMTEFLRAALVRRDPSLAPPPEASAPAKTPSPERSARGAARLRVARRGGRGARFRIRLFRRLRADKPGAAPHTAGARDAGQEPVRGDEAARAAARRRRAGVRGSGRRVHRAGEEPVERAERSHLKRAGGTGGDPRRGDRASSTRSRRTCRRPSRRAPCPICSSGREISRRATS